MKHRHIFTESPDNLLQVLKRRRNELVGTHRRRGWAEEAIAAHRKLVPHVRHWLPSIEYNEFLYSDDAWVHFGLLLRLHCCSRSNSIRIHGIETLAFCLILWNLIVMLWNYAYQVFDEVIYSVDTRILRKMISLETSTLPFLRYYMVLVLLLIQGEEIVMLCFVLGYSFRYLVRCRMLEQWLVL